MSSLKGIECLKKNIFIRKPILLIKLFTFVLKLFSF